MTFVATSDSESWIHSMWVRYLERSTGKSNIKIVGGIDPRKPTMRVTADGIEPLLYGPEDLEGPDLPKRIEADLKNA